ALVKTLLRHLVYSRSEIVFFDMEAGLENFSRGTVRNTNILIIVSEPSRSSITTLKRIIKHGRELGMDKDRLWVVFNKWPDLDEQRAYSIVESLDVNLLGVIPFTQDIVSADMEGVPLLDSNAQSVAIEKVIIMKNRLLEILSNENDS
ncbi:MAG: carbon monoxide dehydrogenase, partial [Candidatus Hodarchaeales archaeon]